MGRCVFSEPFCLQDVLGELSQFGLNFPINGGESEGEALGASDTASGL